MSAHPKPTLEGEPPAKRARTGEPPVPSSVEAVALEHAFPGSFVDGELVPTVVTDSFPALGKLTALRFLEWVQANPGGVVSLPTGKTPEYFIKYVQRYLDGWEKPEIQEELRAGGLDPTTKPDMFSLHFVQIDEFYPMESDRANSFYSYVLKFYIEGFGMDPAKGNFIRCEEIGAVGTETMESVWQDGSVDLSLRWRFANTPQEERQKAMLERIDQWCMDFEERVRALGGVGFFLGGVGPDGHIAFNCAGSDHASSTRLSRLNYPTQAAAAGSLGGIEVARTRLAITLGLGTISYNPDATVIIMAAGEAKAKIVRKCIEEPRCIGIPGSVLQVLRNARFFITTGAAKLLHNRRILALRKQSPDFSDADVEHVLVDLSVATNKRLIDLTNDDVALDPAAAIVVGDRDLATLTAQVRQSLIDKLAAGTRTMQNTSFLHTEPHHDDIMLGYMPAVVRQTREATNKHVFTCLTSGFNSVTNGFTASCLETALKFLDTSEYARLAAESDPAYFDPANEAGRARDVWQFLDGVAAKADYMVDEGVARRMIRNVIGLYGVEPTADAVRAQLNDLLDYVRGQYAGAVDNKNMQLLKGMCREFEAETLWGILGWTPDTVHHLRLGFYSSDIFNEQPKHGRDVEPVVDLLKETDPDIVGVTIDPEASGPDTHYKVLQAITAALKAYEKGGGRSDVKVWGYRNVWFRFHPSEVNVAVPVSINTLSILETGFLSTFLSQKTASFPSHELDGPFCDVARAVQTEQYHVFKTCLGREWFHSHPSPLFRATRGIVYIKEMDLETFYNESRALENLSHVA